MENLNRLLNAPVSVPFSALTEASGLTAKDLGLCPATWGNVTFSPEGAAATRKHQSAVDAAFDAVDAWFDAFLASLDEVVA